MVVSKTARLNAAAAPDSRPQAPPRNAAFARLARGGQVALGLIWLIDGALQFQPYMFGKSFVTGVLLPNAAGQPGIIGEPIRWIAHLIEPRVALFNAFAAVVQCLIGLGLLNRRTVKPALLLSLAWVPGVWFTGEGLGGFFDGTANPLTGAPGAVLLYALIALMVWPRSERGRFSELGMLGVRGARIVWAALWGGFAILWLLPSNDSTNGIHDAITSTPTGAGWLTSLLSRVGNATGGDGTAIALALGATSAIIAVAVLRNWHPRPFLYLSIVIALAYWVFGQGFGGVLTGQATDVNTGPLLVLIAVLLLGVTEIGPRQHLGAREPSNARSGESPTGSRVPVEIT